MGKFSNGLDFSKIVPPTEPQEKAKTEPTENINSAARTVNYKKAVKETKSKHMQFLLTPSNYEAIKEYGKNNGISMNELINALIETHIK